MILETNIEFYINSSHLREQGLVYSSLDSGCAESFKISTIREGFIQNWPKVCEKAPDITENVKPFFAYCVYVVGESEVSDFGYAWNYGDNLYWSKVSKGVAKDLYKTVMVGDIDTVELDWDTREVIASYINMGATKVDSNGNVLQESLKIDVVEDIPSDVVKALNGAGFTWLPNINYIAEKPYGTTVEFFEVLWNAPDN